MKQTWSPHWRMAPCEPIAAAMTMGLVLRSLGKLASWTPPFPRKAQPGEPQNEPRSIWLKNLTTKQELDASPNCKTPFYILPGPLFYPPSSAIMEADDRRGLEDYFPFGEAPRRPLPRARWSEGTSSETHTHTGLIGSLLASSPQTRSPLGNMERTSQPIRQCPLRSPFRRPEGAEAQLDLDLALPELREALLLLLPVSRTNESSRGGGAGRERQMRRKPIEGFEGGWRPAGWGWGCRVAGGGHLDKETMEPLCDRIKPKEYLSGAIWVLILNGTKRTLWWKCFGWALLSTNHCFELVPPLLGAPVERLV